MFEPILMIFWGDAAGRGGAGQGNQYFLGIGVAGGGV